MKVFLKAGVSGYIHMYMYMHVACCGKDILGVGAACTCTCRCEFLWLVNLLGMYMYLSDRLYSATIWFGPCTCTRVIKPLRKDD